MTGFVFTFSLFCTALLQGDPAVLPQVELVPVRQIIDAVLPEARTHRPRAGRNTIVPPPCLHTPPAAPETPPSWGRLDGSTDGSAVARQFLLARPIRAPASSAAH